MNKCILGDILKKLNKRRIIQESFDPWCLNDYVTDTLLIGTLLVEDGLLTEYHKGFETGVTVFKFQRGPYDGEIIGIRMITDMDSESWDFSDCDFPLEFSRMKEETVTTYTPLTTNQNE